jgi:hypothetical protein
MSVTPSYDESIPVLTEVVPGAAAPADEQPAHASAAQGAAAGTQGDDGAWKALEERLVARVLDRLQDRVELALEDQVRSSMAPVLDHVVTRLASELRAGLQQTVEEVVARAVAQELAHLRTSPSTS